MLLQLAGALAWFWQVKLHFSVGFLRYLENVLTQYDERDAIYARGLTGYGSILSWKGDVDNGLICLTKGLELWRKNQLQIDQLAIPGAEPLGEFKSRVESMLNDWLEMHEVDLLIAVSTRSVLIMLVNLVRLANDFRYSRYRPYDFEPCSATILAVHESTPQVIAINMTEHLDGAP